MDHHICHEKEREIVIGKSISDSQVTKSEPGRQNDTASS